MEVDPSSTSGFGAIVPDTKGFASERETKRSWIKWPMPIAIREMSKLMTAGKCLADARKIIRSRQAEPPPIDTV